jgi:hypothetical protein
MIRISADCTGLPIGGAETPSIARRVRDAHSAHTMHHISIMRVEYLPETLTKTDDLCALVTGPNGRIVSLVHGPAQALNGRFAYCHRGVLIEREAERNTPGPPIENVTAPTDSRTLAAGRDRSAADPAPLKLCMTLDRSVPDEDGQSQGNQSAEKQHPPGSLHRAK